ncbi:hypothetical protein HF289_07825 [Acidithiobacillus ferrooxidans]|uniref:glycosyl transferase family 90 n=1 Tax=Acidithiobacillus ferrooxidans TaxID=920 RepID=UPI001C070015|nr:glycosyl transferase family 90 [Acidithiobacillus ferrooxidans]MBU2856791.1 hypothetical protein [Acidithiobacillus ferrooxidans]
MKKILNLYGLKSIKDWDDGYRYDENHLEKIESIAEYLEGQIASVENAVMLYYMFMGQEGGGEREGRSLLSIMCELVNSAEYRQNLLFFHFTKLKLDNVVRKLSFSRFNIYLDLSSPNSYYEGVFSCLLKVTADGIAASFSKDISADLAAYRFAPIVPMIQLFFEKYYYDKMINKMSVFSFGDQPTRDKCVAFCSNKNDYLIPDFDFLLSYGYGYERQFTIPEWDARSSLAYFRGTDTGCLHYTSIENCQRIKLALLSKKDELYIDAAITGVQGDNQNLIAQYKNMGIFAKREPQEKIFEHKFNIDVDGNSNSWSGFFKKLLSGSVVLKVESSEGFRQWFYNRLEPFVNYVPIKADLSDLKEKVQFLRNNDLHAREIAINGRELALSIDYQSSLEYGALVLCNAFKGL